MVLLPCCSFLCVQMFPKMPRISKQMVQKQHGPHAYEVVRSRTVCLKLDQNRQKQTHRHL